MPDEREEQERARRQRAAEVLRALYELAGRPPYAEIARQSQRDGQEISDQTVTNLLTGATASRTRSVLALIAACLHYARHDGTLRVEQDSTGYWKARFDDAAGRVADAEAGLVRIGVPPREADAFTPRSALTPVYKAVDAGKSVVLTQPPNPARSQVFSGQGGVGKTQLAAQYARQVWRDPTLELAVWVSARTLDSVIYNYAQAAARLLGADATQPELAARQLMAWLATTSRTWLIVLDDVQTPGDVADWWPTPTEAGQVIITTRYRGEALSRRDRQLIEVDVYTESEAMLFLRTKLAGHPRLFDSTNELDRPLVGLAEDLGYLPLALAHATAFMINSDVTSQGYRERFARQHTLLSQLFPRRQEIPDQYQATIETTWAISVDLADTLAPVGMARPLMVMASLLDSGGIPAAMFTTEAVLNHLARLLGRSLDATDAQDAVRVLHRLNLLTVDQAGSSREVRVHGLVQRATREDAAYRDQQAVANAANTAADAVRELWPDVEQDGALVQSLRNNTEALWSVAEATLLDPGVHSTLFRAGRSLFEAGLVRTAIDYFQQLEATVRGYLGPDHVDSLIARSYLARAFAAIENPAEVSTMLVQLLADQLRVLGPDAPDTLFTRGYLARVRGQAGDLAGAANAFGELLADQVRVCGPDSHEALETRNNLARVHGEAGDPAGAAAAYNELLTDQLRVLGADAPETLMTRHNLAFMRGVAGDPIGALIAFVELLADRKRVLGMDHPSVLITRSSIARMRGEAGDPAGAAAGYGELLADQLRVLGPDHPDTLTSRHNLAIWRGHAGDVAGAAAAFADLLPITQRMFGPDHPKSLITRSNIARMQGAAGDPAGAAAAYGELLADQLRVLGPDHPDTLTSRHNQATLRGKAGDPAGAAAALADLLPVVQRVFGPDHPNTQSTKDSLAVWRKQAGQC